MTKPVVCRVAPSPTGKCHLGTARTALYSYLTAKKHGGTFLIRMEDTDTARSTKEFAQDILNGLEWLGIQSDIPIVYQSERSEIYAKYVQRLLDEGKAYKCYCSAEELDAKRQEQVENKETPLYDRTCDGKPDQPDKPYVVRFRTEDHGGVQWKDCVLGKINVRKAQISDFIIQRRDGSVGYLLANVIDDALQGVTHVVRGIDGQANAPAQIMLFEALGFDVPVYAHTPFILNDKGEKLSKRNGDASLMDYKDAGMLPEAMINALVRVGWSHGNDEIFSMDELIEKFDLNHVSKSSGSLDPKKFEHINKHWIKVGDPVRIAALVVPYLWDIGIPAGKIAYAHYPLSEAVKTLQSRTTSLKDMAEKAKFYYHADFTPERGLTDEEKTWLAAFSKDLGAQDFKDEDLQNYAEKTCEALGVKINQLFPAVRMALAGRACAPPVVEMLSVLGKEESLKRINKALD